MVGVTDILDQRYYGVGGVGGGVIWWYGVGGGNCSGDGRCVWRGAAWRQVGSCALQGRRVCSLWGMAEDVLLLYHVPL